MLSGSVERCSGVDGFGDVGRNDAMKARAGKAKPGISLGGLGAIPLNVGGLGRVSIVTEVEQSLSATFPLHHCQSPRLQLFSIDS